MAKKKHCTGLTFNGSPCEQPPGETGLCLLHTTVYGLVQRTVSNPNFQNGVDAVMNYVAKVVTSPFQKTKKPPPQSELTDEMKARLVLNFDLKDEITPEMIKERRKKLAMLYHPDQNQGRDTSAQMKQVNWAVDVLLKT